MSSQYDVFGAFNHGKHSLDLRRAIIVVLIALIVEQTTIGHLGNNNYNSLGRDFLSKLLIVFRIKKWSWHNDHGLGDFAIFRLYNNVIVCTGSGEQN